MKDNNQHIDHLFQESLKGYRHATPVRAWERLKDDLMEMRRRRRIILYRWVAAAAVIIIAFLAGYYLATFRLDQQVKQPATQLSQVTPSENQTGQESSYPEPLSQNNISTKADNPPVQETTPIESLPAVPATDNRAEDAMTAQPKPSGGTLSQSDAYQERPTEQHNEMAQVQPGEADSEELPQVQNEEMMLADEQAEQKEVVPELVPAYDWTDVAKQETSALRWSIGGSFAPVYAYRSIRIQAEELPPDVNPNVSYYNDAEKEIYSYSGGLDVFYQMKEKWAFQTGLYLSNLGHTHEEVIAYEVTGVKDILTVSSSAGVIDIKPSKLPEEFVNSSIRRDSTSGAFLINSDIYQELIYLELPLLIRYSLIDKRFGFDITGGLSPGIMTSNNTYFQYDGQQIDLDRNGDFYSMIYNTQVGMGLKYNITGSFSVSLDPAFKYSLNSIRKDHSIEYHPYSISLFTGFHFSF